MTAITSRDLLPLQDYTKRFRGTAIRDCAVVDRGLFYFISVQVLPPDVPEPFDSELETRLSKLELDGGEQRWRTLFMEGYSNLMVSGPGSGDTVCVAVDRRGQVLARQLEGSREEQDIPGGGGQGPCRGTVTRIKPLAGRLYGCSTGRGLFYRMGPDQWVEVGPLPPPGPSSAGFQDFDGFSATDIYAGGGRSDLWHCNGQSWRKLTFPPKLEIQTVCCAGDGYVYIGCQGGHIYRGRNDEWSLVFEGYLDMEARKCVPSAGFEDMLWFHDRVYIATGYSLWEIVDGQLQPTQAPREISACGGSLSVADGVMLVAADCGAALHDGTAWSMLFSITELERQAGQA